MHTPIEICMQVMLCHTMKTNKWSIRIPPPPPPSTSISSFFFIPKKIKKSGVASIIGVMKSHMDDIVSLHVYMGIKIQIWKVSSNSVWCSEIFLVISSIKDNREFYLYFKILQRGNFSFKKNRVVPFRSITSHTGTLIKDCLCLLRGFEELLTVLWKLETFNSIHKISLLLECVTDVLPLNSLIGHLAELRAGLHYGGEVHRSWKTWNFSIAIGRKCNSWSVGVYTRWRKQWWRTFFMDDKMTWSPTWRHFLELGFSGLKSPDKKLLL